MNTDYIKKGKELNQKPIPRSQLKKGMERYDRLKKEHLMKLVAVIG